MTSKAHLPAILDLIESFATVGKKHNLDPLQLLTTLAAASAVFAIEVAKDDEDAPPNCHYHMAQIYTMDIMLEFNKLCFGLDRVQDQDLTPEEMLRRLLNNPLI